MELLTMRRPLNPNPTQAVLVNTLAAIAALVVFFGVLHLADQDLQAASKLDAIDAEAQALETRMNRAAAALCRAEAGPGARPVWTPDGALLCTTTAKATQ
jgi:hypothetical protein